MVHPLEHIPFFIVTKKKPPLKGPPSANHQVFKTPGFQNTSTAAYTWDDLGHWYGWSAHHLVLCPKWFELDRLQDKVEEAKKKPSMQKFIDNFKRNPSRSLFHETYHWYPTGTLLVTLVSLVSLHQRPSVFIE